MKNYQILARAVGALNRCIETKNIDGQSKHQARIDAILEGFPHGSGFDSGTKLDESSTSEKLVFNTAFHHMDENGMYNGWTEHQVVVTPSLELEYQTRITGPNRNEIRDYVADTFNGCLEKDQPEYADLPNPKPELY